MALAGAAALHSGLLVVWGGMKVGRPGGKGRLWVQGWSTRRCNVPPSLCLKWSHSIGCLPYL